MKEAVPNYYHKFQCIADRCNHNCCIGWEIDIDEETMVRYSAMDGEMWERIRHAISGEVPHFILQAGDRCPFLNEAGLCDIICECGEEALCEICTLHPRFRNFYADFIETGLGLCCEEAARIILSETHKFSMVLPQDVSLLDEERLFFARRQKIFDILQDREKSIKARFSILASAFGFNFNFSLDALCSLYLSLERLDEAWTKEIDALKGFSFDGGIFEDEAFQIRFEQLSVYFVFRHLTEAMWDGGYESRVRFVLMSCYYIGALWARHRAKKGHLKLDELADIARRYSAEVEYSEENLEILMQPDFLG